MSKTLVADLKIYKTVDDSTPRLGQEITWKIEVRNEGPDTANNVLVTDLIPEGVTLVDNFSSGGSFSQPGDVWSIGHMAPGAVEVLTLKTVVDTADHAIAIRSTVSTDSHDCDLDDNTHSATAVPWKPTHADLQLSKTVNNDTPTVGSNVAWTLSVSNDGPDTAWNTVINDKLPEGLTYISSTNNAYDAENGMWKVGHLESGQSAEIEVVTSVDSTAGSNYVNRAVASSSTVDSNPDNNSAEASIEPIALPEPPPPAKPPEGKPPGGKPDDDKPHGGKPDHHKPHGDKPHHDDHNNEPNTDCYQCGCLCSTEKEPTSGADLQISKFVSNPTPDFGTEVIWTIVVENNGPEDAENVVVNDSLPGGLEHTGDNATMGEFDETLGIWNIGDLANGSSAVLQITTVATNAEFAQVNIAIVGSDTEDSDPSNNIDHASIDAVGADLVIEKSVSDSAPDLGDSVTWTINVSNNGPDTAENVVVEDTLPQGVIFESASSEDYSDPTGIWTIGNLASGESTSLDIVVTVTDADGPRVNVAAVSSDTAEIDPTNNTAEAQTDAIAADLELDKGVIPKEAAPGDIVTWELTLTNKGPDDATGVIVQDILPEGLRYESDTSQQGSTFNADTGEWTVGDLQADTSTSITIQATVLTPGEFNNTAQVTAADQVDPDSEVNNDDGDQSEDDEANATLSVPSIIDLELTQVLSATEAQVGDTVTFTIEVKNTSTVDATGVSVSNAGIPEYVDSGDLSILDPDSAFDPVSGSWVIGDLAAGDTITLEVAATVNNAIEITNAAQVQTAIEDDLDSIPGNNIDSEDDQASVGLTVIDPGPTANDETYSITPDLEPTNAVFMIDHSGSMGTLSPGPDQGSFLGADIPLPNGGITSRLQLVRDAVVDIAEREQISNVKILGFDGSSGGAGNISQWFDVGGSNPDTGSLQAFLDALEPSGFTNYVEALETSIEYTNKTADGSEDDIPTEGVSGTNYYFLTDGNPLSSSGEEPATPSSDNELAWQNFVDTTFDNAYGIGFGPGVTQLKPIEQVAHQPGSPDSPEEENDDPNSLLAMEADDIPAALYDLIANSVPGNVITNDEFGTDAEGSITQLTVGQTTYEYNGTEISISSGTAPDTTVIREDSMNTITEIGGRLEFKFTDGSFEYFAPYTQTAETETFDYTISDSTGNTDTGTLTIEVEPEETETETPTLLTTTFNFQPLSEEEYEELSTTSAESVPAIADPQLALILDDQSLVI